MAEYSAGSAKITINPNMGSFKTKLKSELERMDVELGVDIVPDADGFRERLRAAMGDVPNMEVKVDADTSTAAAELARVARDREATIRVDVDRSPLDSLASGLDSVGQRSTGVAQALGRIAIAGGGIATIGTLASGAVGPLMALSSAAATASGALLVLPGAMVAGGAGIAALAVGAGGLKDAFSAMGQEAESAGEDTSKAARSAQRSVEAAQRGIVQAQRNVEDANRGVEQAHRAVADAQRGVEKAAQGIADAEQGVADAQRESQRAQQSLNDARSEAVRDLKSMNEQLQDSALDEEAASLAVARARENLQKTLSDPKASGLDRQEADLRYREQVNRLQRLRERNQQLAEDVKRANDAGVEGSARVVAAKERVERAARGEADAQRRVSDAQQAMVDAQQRVADANQGVIDAQQRVADAQEGVREANQRLADSLLDLNEAQSKATGGVDKFGEAMAKLSPNARGFVTAIQGLRSQWTDLRLEVQDNLFAGMGESITRLANTQLPTLRAGLSGVASEINGGVRASFAELSTSAAQMDFSTTLGNARGLFAGLAQAAAPLTRVWIDIATVGSTYLPRMGQAIANVSQRLSTMVSNARQTGRLNEIINNGIGALQSFGRIAGNVGGALAGVFRAATASSGGLLGNLERVTGAMRQWTQSAQGQEALRSFFTATSEALAAVVPLALQFAQIFGTTIAPAISSFIQSAAPGFSAFLSGLQQGLAGLAPAMGPAGQAFGALAASLAPVLSVVGQVAGALLQGLAPAVTQMAPVLGPLIVGFGGVAAALVKLSGPLGVARRVLVAFKADANEVTWLTRLRSGFSAVSGFVGRLVGGLQSLAARALPLVINGVRTFGAALAANPIGAVITAVGLLAAALTFFFAKTETGKRVFAQLKSVMAAFGGWLSGVFAGIFRWLGEVVHGVTERIKSSWRGAMNLIRAIYNSVVKPTIDAFASLFRWLGENIVKPLLKAMSDRWRLFAEAMRFIKDRIIKPTFDAIGDGLRWLRDHIFRPILQWIGDRWRDMGRGIRAVADNVIHPVFDGLKRGLEFVKSAFQRVVDGIGKIWDKLRAATAKPVKFVIDSVWNKGIVGAWNKIAGFVSGLDKASEYKPSWLGAYATGGVLPGYTPGRDVHEFNSPTGGRLLLSGGEAIMRPEWTRAVGGPAAVERMNHAARSGKLTSQRFTENERIAEAHSHYKGGVLAFANGGVVEAMTRIVQQKYPHMQMTSGYRASNDYHGAGLAGDFSDGFSNTPAMLALANDIANTYPGSLELIHEAPGFDRQIKNGQFVGPGGGSYGFYAGAGDHRNHVHWAMNVPPTLPFGGGVFKGGSGGGGLISAAMGWIAEKARGIWDKAMEPIKKRISGVWDSVKDSLPAKLPGLIFKTLKDKAWDFIKSKFPIGDSGSGYKGPVGAGVEQWRGLVDKILKAKGLPSSLSGSVLRRMNQESGGNPRAINNWDSNAAAGTPSKGLMQVIDPTFQAHKDPGFDDIWDPEANIRASMNYAIARYGSLPAAYDRAGGYASGGVLPEKLALFDSGGMLEPDMVATNKTTKPEPVFTTNQWDVIRRNILGRAEAQDWQGAIKEIRAAAGLFTRGVSDFTAWVKKGDPKLTETTRVVTPAEFGQQFAYNAAAGQIEDAASVFGLQAQGADVLALAKVKNPGMPETGIISTVDPSTAMEDLSAGASPAVATMAVKTQTVKKQAGGMTNVFNIHVANVDEGMRRAEMTARQLAAGMTRMR
ncbi:transglycosylase SLT domain-containing protein [Corynebacterium auriscanis]|uniref:transglycosylase SLT domain-containing protein n=1 Tax=Corynebacterium auriscanis TaxID=99807 RepID=UPI003CF55F27